MTLSSQHRGRRQWLFQALVSILLLFLRTTASQGIDEEIVVEADPFLLRIFPKPDDFSLEKRVTVLWTVENIVREYFEEQFKDSTETLYIGSGITGLSLVPPDGEDTNEYETIKFLGGAVAFHPASTVTPSKNDLQKSIREALQQDSVKSRLNIYFPALQQVIYVPLVLGVRGPFEADEAVEEEQVVEEMGSSNDNTDEQAEEIPEDVKPTPDEVRGNDQNDPDDREVSEFQSSSNSRGRDNARKTTIGLSAGVALGGCVIVLLIALLIESQRRRMELWREAGRSCASSMDGMEEERRKKKESSSHITSNYYADDEQETTLRLPRIWGVSPTQRMNSGTTRSSDVSASLEGEDILTCTTVDRRSIRNVESFEHQKRLVDTLKKEMMASNAEIHPYMQDMHADNTEPCALSPTDLSAAALENQAPTQPVSRWHAPSDSSFTGSGSGSGYDSPSSPLRAMMGALRKSSGSKDSSSRRKRSQYDSDRAEL